MTGQLSIAVALIASLPVIALTAVPGIAVERPVGSAAVTGAPRVVGYLPSYRSKSFDPAVGKYLTDLIYFSVAPKANGKLDHTDVSLDTLNSLREMRRQHGTRLQIAVGGWGRCREFGPVATQLASRRALVQSLLKYCLDNRLDGVDFDWEFPKDQRESEAYAALLVETKGAFQPHDLLVTVALSPSQQLSSEAYRAVDRVHLMSYDHDGLEHASFDQAIEDINQVTERGLPKEKLLLGIPFYGRQRGVTPETLEYSQIVRKFAPGPAQDLAGGYNFNGMVTVRRKTRLAIERGLLGVMLWELGQDTGESGSLLRAIHAETTAK